MANNPYVNKVVYGNDVVMDITDTTAEEGDVVSGKTFYKASGAKTTGSAVIPDISNCYQTTDTAETDIREDDYFPFYNTSATAKKKSLWSNIVSKLRSLLGTSRNYAKVTAETETINGVTFTVVDSDNIIVNGTASSDAVFYLDSGTYAIPDEDLFLSGCPEGGSSETFLLDLAIGTSEYAHYRDYGSGSIISSLGDPIRLSIRIKQGTTVSDLEFHPSLTPWDVLTNRDLSKMILQEEHVTFYSAQPAGTVVRIPYSGYSDLIKENSLIVPVCSQDIACSDYQAYDGYATVTLKEGISYGEVGVLILHCK